MQAACRRWDSPEITSSDNIVVSRELQSALQYDVFENVALTPIRDIRPFKGGLALPSQYPDFCRHWVGQRIFDEDMPFDETTADVLRCENGNPYVYAGIYIRHFGHFTAECIHRLWVLNRPEFADATVIFVLRNKTVKPLPFFYEYLKFFGIKNYLLVSQPTVVEKLVIAEQGSVLRGPVHPAYLKELAVIHKRNERSPSKTPAKIAVMRGHMPKGRVLGEMALGQYLANQGYVVYKPEEHSLLDQLRTLGQAEKIIITDGSACHLFDLMGPVSADVAFLARRPDTWLDKYSLKNKVRNLYSYRKVSLLFAPKSADGSRVRKGWAISYVQLDHFIAFLKRHDFINGSVPAIENVNFFEDVKRYIEAQFNEQNSSRQSSDVIVELMAEEILRLSLTMQQDAKRQKELTQQIRTLGKQPKTSAKKNSFVRWVRRRLKAIFRYKLSDKGYRETTIK